MQKLTQNKRGFSTVQNVMGALLGVGFMIIFSLVFFTNLTDDGITGTGTVADTTGDGFLGNYSAGVANVSDDIPTVFNIAVFVLIITVLLIAYVFARRNGIMGGSQLG